MKNWSVQKYFVPPQPLLIVLFHLLLRTRFAVALDRSVSISQFFTEQGLQLIDDEMLHVALDLRARSGPRSAAPCPAAPSNPAVRADCSRRIWRGYSPENPQPRGFRAAAGLPVNASASSGEIVCNALNRTSRYLSKRRNTVFGGRFDGDNTMGCLKRMQITD